MCRALDPNAPGSSGPVEEARVTHPSPRRRGIVVRNGRKRGKRHFYRRVTSATRGPGGIVQFRSVVTHTPAAVPSGLSISPPPTLPLDPNCRRRPCTRMCNPDIKTFENRTRSRMHPGSNTQRPPLGRDDGKDFSLLFRTWQTNAIHNKTYTRIIHTSGACVVFVGYLCYVHVALPSRCV